MTVYADTSFFVSIYVKASYDEGIALKGGDRLSPFSEIHTLLLAKAEGRWLISAQDIVKQSTSE